MHNPIYIIYSFGTSHTAGGGFEFNSSSNNQPNPDVYKSILNSKNHFDFSYPNLLANMCNVAVDNYAKQGYGYQRVTRKIIEVVSDDSFEKDKSLFLIEVSAWDRNEFWFNDINDYIIANFSTDTLDSPITLSMANDYHYQSSDVRKLINDVDNKQLFFDFFKKTANKEILINQVQNNFLMLITFLEYNNINYYLTNGDIPINPNLLKNINYQNKIITYDIVNRNTNKVHIVENWVSLIDEFGLTITEESSGYVEDNHQGYSVNQYIANTIYNRMISDGYLSDDKINSNLIELFNKTNATIKSSKFI